MIGKRAKILSSDHVEDLLVFARQTRHPIRNQVLTLLSVKAGLRAGEIANLTWPMLADVGLRDRALIGSMLFSFARITAAISMCIEDYYSVGDRRWIRLHEKGGKRHEMLAHHELKTFISSYIKAAGLSNGKNTFFPRLCQRERTIVLIPDPDRCLPNDTTPGARCWFEYRDLLPQLSCHRNYCLLGTMASKSSDVERRSLKPNSFCERRLMRKYEFYHQLDSAALALKVFDFSVV